ncbi:unnamed protein product, partial [Discosporangium mesarthrocarpum]
MFGSAVAQELHRERRALRNAQQKLALASATLDAANEAFEHIFGSHTAMEDGKGDSVVELNVRGRFMSTMRSTLRLCSNSALAAKFDENRWPATGGDLD